jgi:hypothetical protein
MSDTIDQVVRINEAFDPERATYDDGMRPAPGDEHRAVSARPTTHDGLISTSAGTRAVVWDLGIETDQGVLWVPDTMLDPPYSDI